ncbi:hypothetical protein LWI29_035264 [Acer saccharum]|uniref:Uncharacterized protein n=1 Tax=Acer saccharum TaxID=4024 RepID=A0AA39WBI8_ACESA|nr:hypothetical protein LWI29_035264 [Acer saccharum]
MLSFVALAGAAVACCVVVGSACGSPGKASWPELVGAQGVDAAATIERENPNVSAIILLEGTPVTRDISCTRLLISVLIVSASGRCRRHNPPPVTTGLLRRCVLSLPIFLSKGC